MRAGIWQVSSDGFFSSMFDAAYRALSIIVGDKLVQPILLICAAMLVVGGWILAARFLVGTGVARFNAEWEAKEAEKKAAEEQEASTAEDEAAVADTGSEGMIEPATIGALAATALSMAAEAALKGVVSEGAKDAYKALKEKVGQWAGGDVEALEKEPASEAPQALIAEAVEGRPADERASVKMLADALVGALKSEGAVAVGLDIGKLNALSVQLDSISVAEGTGVRIDEATTTGEFKVGPINVGPSAGKTEQ